MTVEFRSTDHILISTHSSEMIDELLSKVCTQGEHQYDTVEPTSSARLGLQFGKRQDRLGDDIGTNLHIHQVLVCFLFVRIVLRF